MFVTNGKEYVDIDNIVYIERAHFSPYVGQRFGFHVVTESVEGKRERITLQDIYSEDVNGKLEEIIQMLMQHSKHKWVVFEGDKSIYRIDGLKFIVNHAENRIKFATNDGAFSVYGTNEQELEMYKKLLLSEKQFEPENIDMSNFF